MGTKPQHWHIWRVAMSGRAAFMGKPYLQRDAAKKAADRWAGRYRRALTFVHECTLEACSRAPRPLRD
jgi:hypothetical protein